MASSFINQYTRTSWILNQYRPIDEKYVATQATAFGSSSLAATGQNYLAVDSGKQEFGLYKMTDGVANANIKLYGTDKSPLGVEWYKQRNAPKVKFKPADPKLTVPNKYSLKRDTLLK